MRKRSRLQPCMQHSHSRININCGLFTCLVFQNNKFILEASMKLFFCLSSGVNLGNRRVPPASTFKLHDVVLSLAYYIQPCSCNGMVECKVHKPWSATSIIKVISSIGQFLSSVFDCYLNKLNSHLLNLIGNNLSLTGIE